MGVPMHDAATGRVNRISLGLHLHRSIDQQSPSPTRLRGFALVFHIIEKVSAVECESRAWISNRRKKSPPPGRSWRFRVIEKSSARPVAFSRHLSHFSGKRSSLDCKPGQIRVMIFEIAADRFHGGPNPTRRADIDGDPQEWQRRRRTAGRSD
jgi:hypothetical protein